MMSTELPFASASLVTIASKTGALAAAAMNTVRRAQSISPSASSNMRRVGASKGGLMA